MGSATDAGRPRDGSAWFRHFSLSVAPPPAAGSSGWWRENSPGPTKARNRRYLEAGSGRRSPSTNDRPGSFAASRPNLFRTCEESVLDSRNHKYIMGNY